MSTLDDELHLRRKQKKVVFRYHPSSNSRAMKLMVAGFLWWNFLSEMPSFLVLQ